MPIMIPPHPKYFSLTCNENTSPANPQKIKHFKRWEELPLRQRKGLNTTNRFYPDSIPGALHTARVELSRLNETIKNEGASKKRLASVRKKETAVVVLEGMLNWHNKAKVLLKHQQASLDKLFNQ